ncbi:MULTISPECIES: GNAT family N-acetyltransferase [Streptomyces]|uniref:GNAT family N-acetyltransferase n=1 Tax=Streptomyces TaxID=1883 RepID=UPI00224970A3|nr:GNAT family N-acetyltransferase [Streptomyces sp. JHD 1]MCX2970877.1 GNAT family N-acetyltransferase [Streptomyces sp. JHD 1]
MTTATPPGGLCPAPATAVRPATARDAPALYRLSRPFVRAGALRARPPERYARDAGEFLVAHGAGGCAHGAGGGVHGAGGGVHGCVALRCHPPLNGSGSERPAVVYNFCVASASQGRGVGSALLAAVLATARARSVTTVFTATTGDGALFLRHGFTACDGDGAPAAWRVALDPRRGSTVLRLPLTGAA